MVHAVDDDAYPQVLAGPVARPLVAGADQHGDGVRGLPVDPLDPAAQLRVDQSGLISSR